jgi:hypothetical protein
MPTRQPPMSRIRTERLRKHLTEGIYPISDGYAHAGADEPSALVPGELPLHPSPTTEMVSE